MNAIEFSTKIHHGIIELPKEYTSEFGNIEAKVIILVEHKEKGISRKDKLKLAFEDMKNINMFSEIENPIEWQKKLRNEWE